MRRFIVVLCLLSVFCVSEAHSQETNTVVVFGNGIMSTETDADNSRNRIEKLLRTTLTPAEFKKLEFYTAYNQSYGLLRDAYESLKQKLGTDNAMASFWRWMGGLEVLPDAVQALFYRVSANFDFSTMVGSEDLSNHLMLYRAKILAGKKVLVVSHSQGNFFANAAYEILYTRDPDQIRLPIPPKSFGIVSVASPAGFVAGNGPHTTLVEDGVIEAIRRVTLPGVVPPLPSNLQNFLSGAGTSDWKGHSFLEEYMSNGSRSVTKIMSDITTAMNGLIQPQQMVEDGIMTILQPGTNAGVNMHIFEPNGSHVSLRFGKKGISGFIEFVFGPLGFGSIGTDHYSVHRSKLETGIYDIGAFYCRGFAPNAVVHIVAGQSVRSFTVPIPPSTTGNRCSSEELVGIATVTVTGDAARGFAFNIEKVP